MRGNYTKKFDEQLFVKRFYDKNGTKYKYLGYQNGLVEFLCVKHNSIEHDTPSHLLGNRGCKICGIEKRRQSNEMSRQKAQSEFIEKAMAIHGDKYDYSKTVYEKNDVKVCIICPKHGEFFQTPNSHLNGSGCRLCGIESVHQKQASNTEEFIARAKEIHGDKYDYSKVNYVNHKKSVLINCPKHGLFSQSPMKHLQGQGCAKCKQSRLEAEMMLFLDKKNIEYSYQHKPSWLGLQSLDFYLPKLNIGIECQGLQHFKAVDIFGGQTGHEITFKRDMLKKQLCDENGVKLLYYSNLGIDYPYHVFENKEELLEEILKK